jgi:hypothetical protein
MKNTGKSINEYYKDVPVVKFPKDENIIIVKIHNTISQRPIQDCIKIEWMINHKRALLSDILLAVNEGLIVDIFVLNDIIPKNKSGKHRKKLFVTQIKNPKLRKKYVNKLIPDIYRQKGEGYPIRYNYNI